MCTQNCIVMTCALFNLSPWLRICSWLELSGNKLYSQVREEKMLKDLPVCTCMCGSAHNCGCVVDGSGAMVAS